MTATMQPRAVPLALAAVEREVLEARTTAVQPAPVRPHAGPRDAGTPPCLFVPGRFATSAAYTDDPDRDIRLFLAARGVGVGSVDLPRTAAAGTGEFLARLGAALGRRPTVLIGHSMGAFLCYLTAALWPERVGGVVSLDGGVISPRRGAAEEIDRLAAELTKDYAGEREQVSARPDTLRSLTGDVLTGRPGAVRRLARLLSMGNMLAPGSDPATVKVAAGYLAALNDGWPSRQTQQARLLSLAGPDEWPERMIAGIRGVPIFAAFGSESGSFRRERARHSAVTADPGADIHEIPGYGHLDVLFGADVRRQVFEPILQWLSRRPT